MSSSARAARAGGPAGARRLAGSSAPSGPHFRHPMTLSDTRSFGHHSVEKPVPDELEPSDDHDRAATEEPADSRAGRRPNPTSSSWRTSSSRRSRSTACAVSTEPLTRQRSTSTRRGRSARRCRCGPERFGALLYHFGTRRLSFLKSPTLLAVVALAGRRTPPPARPAPAPGSPTTSCQLPPGPGHAGRVADDLADGATAMTADRRSPLVEQFQYGLDAPICLTWELTYACNLSCVHCLSSSGPARPARADHRRVQGGDRRARADAGLLRQHRRRRADRAPGLLGARRLRHRPPRRREVLHQRREGSRPPVARGWPPATTSTCRSPSTARPPR